MACFFLFHGVVVSLAIKQAAGLALLRSKKKKLKFAFAWPDFFFKIFML
jgi:hypothetical protein